MAGSAITQSVNITRLIGSPQDMARKAHALLADRFAPAKVRHKPLSILRQEARRTLENLFDTEFPIVKKPDRDRMIEDILSEAIGFGPLEELFRDEGNVEIMVLAANQVIARKGEAWLPTSVRFKDATQMRDYLQKLASGGEPVAAGPQPGGAFDVKLANGFRVIGVLPPAVLDQPPLAVFVRGEPPASPAVSRSGTIANPPRAVPQGGSTGMSFSAATRLLPPPPVPSPSFVAGPPATPAGGVPAGRPIPQEPAVTLPPDPYRAIRARITERLIRKCAAAGVYDLAAISTPELQRIVLAHVEELNAVERLGFDAPMVQRLTLEILAGMSR